MIIKFTKHAEKDYRKLPFPIQKKADKQFVFLTTDYHHPSLRARKMGSGNIFEARIDLHYRFTFMIEGENVFVLTIGMHDEGLGKK